MDEFWLPDELWQEVKEYMIPPPLPKEPHPNALSMWYFQQPAVISLTCSSWTNLTPYSVRMDYKDIWWHYLSTLSTIDIDILDEVFEW
jgi:hypothetical protein